MARFYILKGQYGKMIRYSISSLKGINTSSSSINSVFQITAVGYSTNNTHNVFLRMFRTDLYIALFIKLECELISLYTSVVLAACQRHLPMAEQDSAESKPPAVAGLHSHFIVGSVSEDNSEDETAGKLDLQMEDSQRSLSPSSVSSDSTYEMGFDSLDGPLHNLRSVIFCALVFSYCDIALCHAVVLSLVLENRGVTF